jgi:hypothetical protein
MEADGEYGVDALDAMMDDWDPNQIVGTTRISSHDFETEVRMGSTPVESNFRKKWRRH